MFSRVKEGLSCLATREGRDFLRLWRSCARAPRRRPRAGVRFAGLSFDVPDAPSFFWQYVEIFRNQAYFFPSETPSPVIYDCGANVGMSVAYFKRLYPDARVAAFEADGEIYDYLSRNLTRNGLMKDVTLHRAAVWTDSDGVSFAPDGADGGCVSESGEERVPSVDLAEMLAAESRVDFLKMDIEGAESTVIPHIRPHLKKVRHLFCEYHRQDKTRQDKTRQDKTRLLP